MEVIIITGAAGFLGSAITVELGKKYWVTAIDNRKPNSQLRAKTPKVKWYLLDICHKQSISQIFKNVYGKYDRIDFVLHFAAFWHLGIDDCVEYKKINDQGTQNIIDVCRRFHCKRLIFASTLSVLSKVAEVQKLNEKSEPKSNLPYAQSKISNERMLIKASSALPVVILRVGAGFSQWCELPPLYNLIKHWSRKSLLGRTIPGKGNTGFPYIHRDDLVEVVQKIIARNDQLENCEWFIACESKTVVQKDLYPLVRKCFGHDKHHDSIHLPVWLVRLFLHFKCIKGRVSGNMPDERPWMMDYVDKPWIVDNSYTRKKLDWECESDKNIIEYIPKIIDNFNNCPKSWIERMKRRNYRKYEYEE